MLALGSDPSFVVGRGFHCDGVDDWLDWGWLPANGPNYKQNAAMFGAWLRKCAGDVGAPAADFGTGEGPGSAQLNPRGPTGLASYCIYAAASTAGAALPDGYVFHAGDRSAAAAM